MLAVAIEFIMLSVAMLNVVGLNVVAPIQFHFLHSHKSRTTNILKQPMLSPTSTAISLLSHFLAFITSIIYD